MPIDPDREPLECDLVMKGGVTSGIIYPGAIAAIAKTYRLRSVGGTSAGAIGAAAAAAMEFGRRSGRNAGARERLAGLAAELGADRGGAPLLTRLFEPDPPTAGLFRLALRLQAAVRARGAAGAFGVLALTPFLWATLAATVTAAVLLGAEPSPTPTFVVALVLLLALGVPALTVGLAVLAWLPRLLRGLRAVAANGFGFCSGMAGARSGSEDLPSLTGWLHLRLQELAGLPEDEPLTFGDLWAAAHRRPGLDRAAALRAACVAARGAGDTAVQPRLDAIPRDVELALVASDVNRAQSVQLPFMRRDDLLFATRGDLEALFPRSVVRWMDEHQRAPTHGGDKLHGVELHGIDPSDVLRLPRPEDLPVIAAVRMSLSFPFLFRAVRIHVLRQRAASDGGGRELAELWIADGGITSNFPLHLFDSPVPTRPTFCLNLLYHDDELQPDGATSSGAGAAAEAGEAGLAAADAPSEDLVYMLRTNRSRLAAYTRFGEASAAARLLRFAGRVVTTARQWGDNQLIDVPGFRDRIVHVRMREDEGGFNFDMCAGKIGELQRRGERAGSVIARRFVPNTREDPLHPGEPLALNWANHRLVRLRAFLAGLEVAASRFCGGWDLDHARAEVPATNPMHVSPSLERMVEEAGTAAEATMPTRPGYPFANARQRELALDMVERVRALAVLSPDPSADGVDFVAGRSQGPKPKQSLRLRSPVDTDPRAERP